MFCFFCAFFYIRYSRSMKNLILKIILIVVNVDKHEYFGLIFRCHFQYRNLLSVGPSVCPVVYVCIVNILSHGKYNFFLCRDKIPIASFGLSAKTFMNYSGMRWRRRILYSSSIRHNNARTQSSTATTKTTPTIAPT